MATLTASPQAVIERIYGQVPWVEDYQVRLLEDRFVEATLYLAASRPVYWMDVLDNASSSVFDRTLYRTLFACYDASGDRDLLT